MSSGSNPLAAVHNITKRFPGVVANEGVSLELHAGEVHALLGENGAGKSTLISMLAGMQQPDAGEILIGGRVVTIASPRHSLSLGIGTVLQHALLVSSLTVLENLMLGGRWWERPGRSRAEARFRELSALLGVSIDPHAPAGGLSLGEQQQIEIIRALWRGGQLLILDEPTSMLTPQGVEDLGRLMRRLKEQGVGVVLVTHKLLEAYEFADRISVLCQGRLVGQIAPEQLVRMNAEEAKHAMVHMMFGDRAADSMATRPRARNAHRGSADGRGGSPRLSVRALSSAQELADCPLQEVSFDLWPGEILGIAGVDGNGQKALAEVLAGQRPLAQGQIVLEDLDVTGEDAPKLRQRGVRYITDDRLREGTVGAFSVAINLVLKEIGREPYWRHGILDTRRIHQHARETIHRDDIRTPSETTPLGRLSGGNIQKVLLARELDEQATVAILSKPTHGLDVQSTDLAHGRIIASAKRGVAIVLISTDLEELVALSERIGVLYQGRLTGILDNVAGVERAVGLLMTGATAA